MYRGLEEIIIPNKDGDKTTFERDIECGMFGIKHNYDDVTEHLKDVYKEAFDKGSQRVEEIFGAFSKQALQAYEDRLEQKRREKMREQEKRKEAIHNL